MASRPRKREHLEAARAKMYRDLVLECAERVFAEQGFDSGTMQDVANEAGISLKTLYSTFPGKQDLFDAILEVRGAEFLGSVAAETEGIEAPLELLKRSIRGYVRFFAENRSFLMLNLREPRAWAVGPLPEVEGWRRTRSLLTSLMRRGIESGVFYAGDADRAAEMVTAILQVQMMRLVEPGADADSDAVADEILVQLERLLCPPRELHARSIARAAR